jgi:hypothetical protein
MRLVIKIDIPSHTPSHKKRPCAPQYNPLVMSTECRIHKMQRTAFASTRWSKLLPNDALVARRLSISVLEDEAPSPPASFRRSTPTSTYSACRRMPLHQSDLFRGQHLFLHQALQLADNTARCHHGADLSSVSSGVSRLFFQTCLALA